jgi:exo-beta-1,3-glucanase (GH17 family)
MKRAIALALVVLFAALEVAAWWWCNRPIPVALSFNEPFPSVSFAPFRRGQSPLTHTYPPSEQIAEDLKSLVGVTRGVRTYTSLEGMDFVPAVAKDLGIEVTHSAWLGAKITTNDREVEALIKAANAYPDTIKRVIVGNEVLLRQDLKPGQLIEYIRKVKARVKQPVSYADVWAFWLKYPEVAKEVDYITIHILPYWEDEPIGVDGAADHIVEIYQMMAKTFPGKPILIGEAGWPTRGRSRGPAVASMEDGAKFVRTLARVSKENGFDYNVVEAFDQPWKAMLEGTVGANWGVVDAERRVKFAMSGPVEPNPFWARRAVLATILGVLGALYYLRRAESYSVKGLIAVAALAQLLAGLVVWQGENALALAYNNLDDVWAAIRIAVHAALGAFILQAAGQGFRIGADPAYCRWGERLVPLYGFAAVAMSMLLLFNGRYRDTPPMEFLVPCVGLTAFAASRMWVRGEGWIQAFAVGRLFGGTSPGGFGPVKEVLALLGAAALAAPLSEAVALALGDDFVVSHPKFTDQLPMLIEALWINHEMDTWAIMVVVMMLPYLAEYLSRKTQ